MSVKHAVLGLVIERPGYGYELIQRLEQRIEGWRPSETAVYPALRSLRAEGMIRAREATADGGVVSAHRGVVWYEATAVGRDEFRAWVRAPTDLAPQRDPFWLKVAFASPEDLPWLVELARELESACLERMAELSDQGGGSRTSVARTSSGRRSARHGCAGRRPRSSRCASRRSSRFARR